MGKLASCAGREVLIKAVAQVILAYIMSVFKLSKDMCHTIQSSTIRFWWGHNQEDQKIHWISSLELCKSKDNAELGFVTWKPSTTPSWQNKFGG